MTNEEKALKDAAKSGQKNDILVYADWLQEHDRPIEAAQQRQRVSLCQVRYVARKKDLSVRSREYETLASARAWVSNRERYAKKQWHSNKGMWIDLPDSNIYEDYEILVIEYVRVEAGTLPAISDGMKKKRGVQ